MMKIIGKFKQFLKKNPLIFFMIRFIFNRILRLVTQLVPVNEKLILYNSYGGLTKGDSPGVLYEAIRNDPAFSEHRHIWATYSDQKDNGGRYETVKIDTVRYFLVAMRAKFWIANVNIERGFSFKKKQQTFVNTWHSIPLKKMGNAVKGRTDFDFKNIDYLIYSGEYEKKIFLEDFQANPLSLQLSLMPRNDALINFSFDSTAIKKKINIRTEKKLILFAPTWRDGDINRISDKLTIDIENWEKYLASNYVLLFRSHHFAKFKLDPKFRNFVIDVSNYPNITELLAISDILVSDYSSIFFDFALTGKPMFCYARDFENFSTERGFYVDLKSEMPNGLIMQEDDLLNKIVNCDTQLQFELTQKFYSSFIDTRTLGTERCINFLKGKI